MRFASPYFLLLLGLIPVFHYWFKNREKSPLIRFPGKLRAQKEQLKTTAVLKRGKGLFRDPRNILKIIRYAALVFLVIALARPQSSYQVQHRSVDGIDIIMVMDVSASMNIEDLDQRSRFDVAKTTMRDFVQGRQNDRIGFVVFSGEPFTLVPPTLDYGLVLRAIADAQSGVLKDGTGIGDGLALAVNRLKASQAKSKVIVLLTDGDNNVGQVDPETAGELAAGYGTRVYTIAIGTEGRVKLPIKRKNIFGQTVVSYQWFENALNPELLKKIADNTRGKFYRVTDASALASVFQEIDQLEKSAVQSTERTRYDEKFSTPLKLALLLLLIEQVLAYGMWRFAL